MQTLPPPRKKLTIDLEIIKRSVGNKLRPLYGAVKRIIVWADEWGLVALIILLLTCFTSAVFSVSDLPYDSVSLIKIISNVLSNDKALENNIFVQIFQPLKNVVVIWAGAKIYLNTAGLRIDEFIAKHLVTGHTVIVSSYFEVGNKGHKDREHSVDKTALAIDLARSLAQSKDSKEPIVLVARSIDEVTRTTLWDEGIIVLTHDIPLSQVAKATNLHAAKKLIAMCGDTSANIALTRIANSYAAGDGDLIECKCMIEPLDAKNNFSTNEYFELSRLHKVRVFNESQLLARQLLKTHPPDYGVECRGSDVHILLIGFGTLGQSVLLKLAFIAHFKDFKQPRVTIIDKNINEIWDRIHHQFPKISDWIKVSTKELSITKINEQNLADWVKDTKPFNVVYVCTKDEVTNLRAAKICLESPSIPETAKVVAIDPPGGVMLADFEPENTNKKYDAFSLINGSSDSGLHKVATGLLESIDDEFPIALHNNYCKKNSENNPMTWEMMSESLRESNRHVEDHFEIKLNAIGFRFSESNDHSAAGIQVLKGVPHLTENQWRLLAEMEHNRWWAEKSMNGWTPVTEDEFVQLKTLKSQGSKEEFDSLVKKFKSQMKHHCLRKFDELFPEEKTKDRENIEFCFKFFSNNGKLFALKKSD
jgi:hypothetical protein